MTLTFSALQATHMQKFKVSSQSVPKIEWKQTDGQTDGGDCVTSHANVVANRYIVLSPSDWWSSGRVCVGAV